MGQANQQRRLNRGRPPGLDLELYSHRNTAERGINRLKHWRGLAIRYDKWAPAYLGGVPLAALVIHHRFRDNAHALAEQKFTLANLLALRTCAWLIE